MCVPQTQPQNETEASWFELRQRKFCWQIRGTSLWSSFIFPSRRTCISWFRVTFVMDECCRMSKMTNLVGYQMQRIFLWVRCDTDLWSRHSWGGRINAQPTPSQFSFAEQRDPICVCYRILLRVYRHADGLWVLRTIVFRMPAFVLCVLCIELHEQVALTGHVWHTPICRFWDVVWARTDEFFDVQHLTFQHFALLLMNKHPKPETAGIVKIQQK